MKSVITIGEVLWDVFGATKKPGGSSMNVALHLHKQGLKTQLISAIGDDKEGLELIDFLHQQQFDTALIQTHPRLPTSKVLVTLDKKQQATYEIVKPVAWDEIALTDAAQKAVAKADAFVYCSLTCRNQESKNTILALLKQARLKIFDINLRPPHFNFSTLKELLALADILKINDEELSYLQNELPLKDTDLETVLRKLADLFQLKTICLTLGEKGALLYHQEDFYSHPGYPVTVADTVGAGDSFLATFVASYLHGYGLAETLDRACKVGAFVASQPGANPFYDAEIFKK